jgi:hypothetical protein
MREMRQGAVETRGEREMRCKGDKDKGRRGERGRR